MIDLKIKQLFSLIKTEEQAKKLLSSYLYIFEKIDGTKLTLFRNDIPYDAYDYTKNWIISYKSNIIYKEEFNGFKDNPDLINQIKTESIGTSQYYFVHKYVEEKIHPNAKDLPCNTELFIEFVQRKPTLTRDYEKYHLLFLIGYANNIKPYIDNGRYYSVGNIITANDHVREVAKMLNINLPPTIFEGKIVISKAKQDGQYLNLLNQVTNDLLTNNSVLGGKMEGVVIKTQSNDIYKVTQSDQYDKKIRSIKKNKYKAPTEELENKYWDIIHKVADVQINMISSLNSDGKILSLLSKACYVINFL